MIVLVLALVLAQESAAVLLEARCVKCHAGEKAKGDLDLSTREGLLRGGSVVPGRSKDSLLWRSVARLEEPFMPHKEAPLSKRDVELLAAWIDAGAPYERVLTAKSAAPAVPWAFRPLVRPEGDGVDAFIDAKLRERGMPPAPAAPPRTLIRRLSFDLTGLPPTPEELEEPYEQAVDRLLASPRHGERWARHWLDVARYADSDGYRFDYDRKHAWPYRDFVIRALNEDLPFDVFVRWQVAGDLIEPDEPRAIAATGFCTAGPLQERTASDSARNQERLRYDELDDVVSTVGSAFLGLTVGCARCHDHKFDPIPTRDYYRLVAAFAPSERRDTVLAARAEREEHERRQAEFERRAAPSKQALQDHLDRERRPLFLKKVEALKLREEDREILRLPQDPANQRQRELLTLHQKELKVADPDLRKAMGKEAAAEWDRLAAAVKEVEAKHRPPALPRGLSLAEGKALKAWLLERGQVEAKTEELRPGFLTAIGNAEPPAGAPGRRALAEWLTDVERGAGRVTARVIANRVWQHHFGEGLFRTPNDVGLQGETPTHPELLDWLASELVAGGWRLKRLHRLILLSAAYRRGADAAERGEDPDGRWLSRRRPRRLEAEALRDSILAVSGRLNLEIYGPGVKVPVPAELIITRTEGEHHYPKGVEDGPAVWRRSVYIHAKRSVAVPITEAFDAPSASASCGRRVPTTVAPQALLLLNDPFVRARAKDFAARVEGEADRVGRAFALALGRAPSATEREVAEAFLKTSSLADFCHAMFGLNEFVYVD